MTAALRRKAPYSSTYGPSTYSPSVHPKHAAPKNAAQQGIAHLGHNDSQINTYSNHPSQNSAQSSTLAPLPGGYPLLFVPGLGNSDRNHWQSQWQNRTPHSHRIALDDWQTPDLDAWSAAIRRSLQTLNKPAILIAHSFGTLAAARVAEEWPTQIAGLLLVAPADPDKFGVTRQLPTEPLPVPSLLIASSNDPWMSEQRALQWALHWGSDYLRLNNAGHINSQSKLGLWQEGWTELHRLIDQL